MTFREQWLDAVERKNTHVLVGIDPPLPEFGWDRSIGEINPIDFIEQFLEDVAQHAAGLKPNPQFYQLSWGPAALRIIGQIAQHHDIPVLQDRKLADILATNDAALYAMTQQGATGVTIAPYAGNMAEVTGAARKRGINTFTMGIMSNDEFRRRKDGLIRIEPATIDAFLGHDVHRQFGDERAFQYIIDAVEARACGAGGVVIGAPSPTNGILEVDLATMRHYMGDELLVLMPGIAGKQKGDERAAWKYFGNNLMPNLATELLFEGNRLLTSYERGERAKHYQDFFNERYEASRP